MLRLLEQSGSDRVQVEYDQQWRTFFKALNLGFIEEAPSGGGVLTEKGKLFVHPMANSWTDSDTQAYRAEFEKRFRARTPATRIDEVDFQTRVNRSEMRSWCLSTLGKPMPEMDADWWTEHCYWARRLMRRVVKQQSPDDYERLLNSWKGQMPLPPRPRKEVSR